MRAFLRHRLAVAGLVVIALLAIAARLRAARRHPRSVHGRSAGGAGRRRVGEHWLGTDEVGRDVFSRLIYGARVSLSVGLVAVTIYTLIGTVLGALSGYFGGFVDGAIQRLTDTVMCFPPLIIIIAAVSITRAEHLERDDHHRAADLAGHLPAGARRSFSRCGSGSSSKRRAPSACSDLRLIFRHMLPNALAPVIVSATFGVAAAILTEAGLSFLGLGRATADAELGQPDQPGPVGGDPAADALALGAARVLIAVAVLSINFVGDGLRDALDPRRRPAVRRQAAGGRRQAAGGRRQAAGGRRQAAGGRRQAAGGSESVAGLYALSPNRTNGYPPVRERREHVGTSKRFCELSTGFQPGGPAAATRMPDYSSIFINLAAGG